MGPRRAEENGGALIGLSNNFGPFTFEDPFYVTRNFYDTGITLQPGVSVSIVYDLELLHEVAFATNVGNVNPGNIPSSSSRLRRSRWGSRQRPGPGLARSRASSDVEIALGEMGNPTLVEALNDPEGSEVLRRMRSTGLATV